MKSCPDPFPRRIPEVGFDQIDEQVVMIGQEDQGQEVQAKAPPQFFDPFESVGAIVTIPKNRAVFRPRDVIGS